MASLTELSFNWLGFTSAMISNISFTYRSIYSKKAMVSSHYSFINSIKFISFDLPFVNFLFVPFLLQTDMDSTNIYAYISIIALIFCLPAAIFVSERTLQQLEQYRFLSSSLLLFHPFCFGFNYTTARGTSANEARI